MRTKTLILSGILAALSGASALAQVYSLNAVGYINVNIPTGFSFVADQLYATNQQTSQSIDAIFAPTLLNGGSTLPDPYNNVVIYIWNAAGQAFNSGLVVQQLGGGAPFWSLPALATGNSFNPGQAVIIYNPNAPFTMTFVGQVPQGAVTNTLLPGFNLVSSIIPQTGAVDTDLGLAPGFNDVVYNWSTSGQAYASGDIWQTIGGPGFWSYANGVAPTNTVGTGFFYYSPAAAGTSNNWVRTFNIN